MRTVSPQKKFLSTNPDYDYPHNTAGNFTPPYTGKYYMRAVGGGGSGSLRNNTNECVGGGAGGGYDGEIFLIAGDIIPYSVGVGGAAAAFEQDGNAGTDTIFGNIILSGGYAGTAAFIYSGRGGSAGICKGGVTHLNNMYITSRLIEQPQSSGNLFGGGGGMAAFHSDTYSHFNHLANGCGKNVRTKSQINTWSDAPHQLRFGGCSIFGLSAAYIGVYGGIGYGTGGDVFRSGIVASNGAGGRIQIWRLQ